MFRAFLRATLGLTCSRIGRCRDASGMSPVHWLKWREERRKFCQGSWHIREMDVLGRGFADHVSMVGSCPDLCWFGTLASVDVEQGGPLTSSTRNDGVRLRNREAGGFELLGAEVPAS